MNKLKDKIIKHIDSLATNLETILFGENADPDLGEQSSVDNMSQSVILSVESLQSSTIYQESSVVITKIKKTKSTDNLAEIPPTQKNTIRVVPRRIFFLQNATSLSEIQNKNTMSSCFKTSPITRSGIENISKITGNFDLVIRSELPIAKDTLKYSKITYGNVEETPLCNELDLDDIITQNYKRIKDFKELLYDYSRKYNRILVITHELFLKYFFEKTETFIKPYKYLVLEEMDDKGIAKSWPEELVWIGKCD
jgi:hypothetical protein